LKIYDISTHETLLEKGQYIFEIGASSRDIRLRKEVMVEGEDASYLIDTDLADYYRPSHPLLPAMSNSKRSCKIRFPKPKSQTEAIY
jgi:hypothetical protein